MDVARFDRPANWDELIAQASYVQAHSDCCKTYVLDTLDWAEQLVFQHVARKAQKSSIEDFGYGKGYQFAGEEFQKLIAILDGIIANGINVVMTAHAKMRKFEQPDEMGAYDRWEMKLSRGIGPMVKEWADMVLFANYKTYAIAVDK